MRWMAAEVQAIAFKVKKRKRHETQIQFQPERTAQRIWRICHPLPVYSRNLRCVEAKVDRVVHRPTPPLVTFLQSLPSLEESRALA
jgi:hypothetical protein